MRLFLAGASGDPVSRDLRSVSLADGRMERMRGHGNHIRVSWLRRRNTVEDSKVRTFIYHHLHHGLHFKAAYWPALPVGSAAQLAAAHLTLVPLPQYGIRHTHLCPSQPHSAMFSGNDSLFSVKPDTHYPSERAVWTGRSNG